MQIGVERQETLESGELKRKNRGGGVDSYSMWESGWGEVRKLTSFFETKMKKMGR